jgi:hypothetical protein
MAAYLFKGGLEMLGQLTKQVKTDYWLNALVAAGTDVANVASTAIDCTGYDRIRVLLFVGATAVEDGTVKFFLTDSETSGGSYDPLSGATIGTHTHGASGETAKIYEIDAILTPGKPFVKVNYQRETENTALLGGIYEIYNNKQVPIAKAENVKEQAVT